jgi:hypothetical protein
LFFKGCHLARHGALGERQLLGGPGEALVAGRSLKAGQGLGGRQAAAHGQALSVMNIHHI